MNPIITAFALRPSQRGEMLQPRAWHGHTWRGEYNREGCARLAAAIVAMSVYDWRAYRHKTDWSNMRYDSDKRGAGFNRHKFKGPRQELLAFFIGRDRAWFEALVDCDPDIIRKELHIG